MSVLRIASIWRLYIVELHPDSRIMEMRRTPFVSPGDETRAPFQNKLTSGNLMYKRSQGIRATKADDREADDFVGQARCSSWGSDFYGATNLVIWRLWALVGDEEFGGGSQRRFRARIGNGSERSGRRLAVLTVKRAVADLSKFMGNGLRVIIYPRFGVQEVS
ncbi:hypothetical protein CASFOL_037576 [Castilleja foliolosa]|uniref:Uncharacterized protein n=1 Tax=Castilleja foliolosa TaxID=1961234 RepID=A0ABD3BMK3_9LAMI